MINVLAKFTKVYKEYIDYLCPFESVIAFYMIDCIENGKYHMITIRELYNIVHVYSAAFVVTTECHTKCACNQLFSVSPIPMSENINKYDHYEGLQYMTQKLNVFNELHPNVKWLYNKCIKYDGKNTDFKLFERRKQMIGYNDTHVYNMTLQPSLSTINYGIFIIRSIIDTLLIMNSSATDKVIFNNKQIVCCAITLENNEIYEINITEIIKSQSSFFIDMVYRIMKMHYGKYHDGYIQALKNKLDTEKIKLLHRLLKIVLHYVNVLKQILYLHIWNEFGEVSLIR